MRREIAAGPRLALRCAVYTRKSSEEGLDQTFNSLHAQREACEAYVKSQEGEGWRCLKSVYDDGGISGGTMDRPALQRLLDDIERGGVDVVVVYKVDRLTRSLADFAQIIEVFDRKAVSFVSVTQAFNTTSSMGRLTLNVLLSFAQFEREVTGERIRDKIAASKAKGMWMGGMPPLGYDIPQDRAARTLSVNETEAEIVRDIFRRYLRLKSVNALRDELARDGVLSKAWVTSTGRKMGGCRFTTGSLFHLLKARVYVGEIVHRGNHYPGSHSPIVNAELFDAVQAQLAANTAVRQSRPTKRASLPLQGLIYDAEGNRMVPTFAYGRRGGCYSYYVSKPLTLAGQVGAETIGRISAKALDSLLLSRLRKLTGQPDGRWDEFKPVLRRVEIERQRVKVRLDLTDLVGDMGPAAISRLQANLDAGDRLVAGNEPEQSFELMIGVRPVFRGGRTWIIRSDTVTSRAIRNPDLDFAKALSKAHASLEARNAGPTLDLDRWRRAESAPDSYSNHQAALAFLAPDIQRAILDGHFPAGLTARQVMLKGVPLAWADQRAMFQL